MYEITVAGHFDAAHFLRNYGGKCENLHGHRWKVEVTVQAEQLNDTGLAFDFTVLKGKLAEILKGLDHCLLNDVTSFKIDNPSSENIASYIFKTLQRDLGREVALDKVRVYESPDSWVTYSDQ